MSPKMLLITGTLSLITLYAYIKAGKRVKPWPLAVECLWWFVVAFLLTHEIVTSYLPRICREYGCG